MAATRKYVPARGDIVFTNFSPAAGHEQALPRPALVISPLEFNRKTGLALMAPITSRRRNHGFEVPITTARTQGVILCHQLRSMDYAARGIRYVEAVHGAVLADVLARIRVLVM